MQHHASPRLSQRLHQRPRQRGRHGRDSRCDDQPRRRSAGRRRRSLLARLAERHGLNLTVVNDAVDPTFPFHDGGIGTADSHGSVLSLCDGPAHRNEGPIRSLVRLRHGPRPARIVTQGSGLLPPNHFLSVAISNLFQNRPSGACGGGRKDGGEQCDDRSGDDKTGPEALRSAGRLQVVRRRTARWIARFGGEESAGASFVRLDGSVWTTDKDGSFLVCSPRRFTARTGRDPGRIYQELTHEFGEPFV